MRIHPWARPVVTAGLVAAFLETALLHETSWLHLPRRLDPLDRARGSRDLAAQIVRLQSSTGAQVVIANKYMTASLLSFYLPGQPDTFMPVDSPPFNQLVLWPTYREKHPGDDAIFVSDSNQLPPSLKADFPSIEPAGAIYSTQDGRKVNRFYVFVCRRSGSAERGKSQSEIFGDTQRLCPTASGRSPFGAYLIATACGPALYLPGLGSLQLQHEEPRRALPALHMLASGDWLVPRVGSEPSLRKPPLLNWAIALSCKLSGGASEWAVRLPSVLATFALTITIVGVGGGRWLGFEGGLVAAIFFLTNITIIETGRLAELEALYISLTGIALVLWMTAWRQEAALWRLWLVPAPFLALGMLTKGPTHLIFYYGVILPVLVFGRDTRSLRHPAHFFSLLLILGALLCWAIPCSLAVSNHNPMGVWRFWWTELSSRASAESSEHFRLSNWLLNGPQTLKNFLPWTLLLPLLWRKETVAQVAGAVDSGPRELALFRGARFGMVATATLMVLVPHGSPRYIYPLIVVPCLLFGRALTVENGAGSPSWWQPFGAGSIS